MTELPWKQITWFAAACWISTRWECGKTTLLAAFQILNGLWKGALTKGMTSEYLDSQTYIVNRLFMDLGRIKRRPVKGEYPKWLDDLLHKMRGNGPEDDEHHTRVGLPSSSGGGGSGAGGSGTPTVRRLLYRVSSTSSWLDEPEEEPEEEEEVVEQSQTGNPWEEEPEEDVVEPELDHTQVPGKFWWDSVKRVGVHNNGRFERCTSDFTDKDGFLQCHFQGDKVGPACHYITDEASLDHDDLLMKRPAAAFAEETLPLEEPCSKKPKGDTKKRPAAAFAEEPCFKKPKGDTKKLAYSRAYHREIVKLAKSALRSEAKRAKARKAAQEAVASL